MFDSEITAATLIADIDAELEIQPSIPMARYLEWLNTLEQLLYSELIKEERCYTTTYTGAIDISEITVNTDCRQPIYEDIYKIFSDNIELFRATISEAAYLTDDLYYRDGNEIYFKLYSVYPTFLDIIYYARPRLKTAADFDTLNVCLPTEFIGLAKSYILSEAYKHVNEDTLAAKWAGEYNTRLTDFIKWLKRR